jgi:hypothetical protein
MQFIHIDLDIHACTNRKQTHMHKYIRIWLTYAQAEHIRKRIMESVHHESASLPNMTDPNKVMNLCWHLCKYLIYMSLKLAAAQTRWAHVYVHICVHICIQFLNGLMNVFVHVCKYISVYHESASLPNITDPNKVSECMHLVHIFLYPFFVYIDTYTYLFFTSLPLCRISPTQT